MKGERTIKTQAYLVIEPTFREGHGIGTTARVENAKVTRLTMSPPKGGTVGAIALKLTIELPESAFKPAEIEATITAGQEHVIGLHVQPEPVESD